MRFYKLPATRFEVSKKSLKKNRKISKNSKILNISKKFGFSLQIHEKLVKLQVKLASKIASKNCQQKLPAETASRNYQQKLPAEIANKNCK